jgi:hypothetical protein
MQRTSSDLHQAVRACARICAALFTALALASAGACGGAQKPKGKAAELRVVAEPPSATVQVNERFVGAARVLDKKPALLTPGPKRVTVEAPGYFPHDLELDLPAGTTTLNVKLRPIPP